MGVNIFSRRYRTECCTRIKEEYKNGFYETRFYLSFRCKSFKIRNCTSSFEASSSLGSALKAIWLKINIINAKVLAKRV